MLYSGQRRLLYDELNTAHECLNGRAHKQAICAEDSLHFLHTLNHADKPTPHLPVRHSENPEGV